MVVLRVAEAPASAAAVMVGQRVEEWRRGAREEEMEPEAALAQEQQSSLKALQAILDHSGAAP